jgi:hypothetical protein
MDGRDGARLKLRVGRDPAFGRAAVEYDRACFDFSVIRTRPGDAHGAIDRGAPAT